MVLFTVVVAVIRDEPRLPPSTARALSSAAAAKNQGNYSSLSNYKRSIGVLLKNYSFVLLLISYGKLL